MNGFKEEEVLKTTSIEWGDINHQDSSVKTTVSQTINLSSREQIWQEWATKNKKKWDELEFLDDYKIKLTIADEEFIFDTREYHEGWIGMWNSKNKFSNKDMELVLSFAWEDEVLFFRDILCMQTTCGSGMNLSEYNLYWLSDSDKSYDTRPWVLWLSNYKASVQRYTGAANGRKWSSLSEEK